MTWLYIHNFFQIDLEHNRCGRVHRSNCVEDQLMINDTNQSHRELLGGVLSLLGDHHQLIPSNFLKLGKNAIRYSTQSNQER